MIELTKDYRIFKATMINNVKTNHNLNLNLYTGSECTYIENKNQQFSDDLSLICKGIKAYEHTDGRIVGEPKAYIKDQNGYVLLKKDNGDEVVYVLDQKNNEWKITDRKVKQGEKFEFQSDL